MTDLMENEAVNKMSSMGNEVDYYSLPPKISDEFVIETDNLTKRFIGGKVAADHVSMHVKKGEIYGFIGRNGAGKTTTMKVILGLLLPTDGDIKLFGSSNLIEGRKKIGSLIEAPGLYKNCSAYENMKRFALLTGSKDEEIKELLDLVGLGNVGKRKAGKFSLGMKQRLGIAIALLGNPELLILDEPINGLDPAGIKELRDCFIRLNRLKGVTILISSHLLGELDKIATTYGIINDGKLVEEISAEDLKKRCSVNLSVTVDNVSKALEILDKANIEGKREVHDNSIVLYGDIEQASEINEILVKAGIKVSSLGTNAQDMEQYFIERIGK
jgi:ABC-2 type transport system ATP-binding protein